MSANKAERFASENLATTNDDDRGSASNIPRAGGPYGANLPTTTKKRIAQCSKEGVQRLEKSRRFKSEVQQCSIDGMAE
jgi:hypothetical protein